MIPYERKQKILELLSEHDLIKIKTLHEKMSSVSISTIRRDLKDLEREGLVTLLPGGAIKLFSKSKDVPIASRVSLNRDKKAVIAKKAAEFVHSGDTVYIDSGSTCTELMRILLTMDIKIITSNTALENLSLEIAADVYSLGGHVNLRNNSLQGELTLHNLEFFNFDKAFLGVNGVDIEKGYTTPNLSEAVKKQKVIERSQEVYYLSDDTKFDKVYMMTIGSIKDTNLICNQSNKKFEEICNVIS